MSTSLSLYLLPPRTATHNGGVEPRQVLHASVEDEALVRVHLALPAQLLGAALAHALQVRRGGGLERRAREGEEEERQLRAEERADKEGPQRHAHERAGEIDHPVRRNERERASALNARCKCKAEYDGTR